MIACAGLTKRYGRVVAADGISFVAQDGLVTGLLGPNGAGKTTTIRHILGLSRPDRGSATVDGIDAARSPRAVRSRLGVLPESVGSYDRLTVREHLMYSAGLQGLSVPDATAAVARILEQLALSALADRLAGQLSQGQARLVALGRALVHGPRNVILDEPTNGLDVVSAREVRREVRRLAETGRAVLFSSHIMPDVSAVCDRIVILSKGRVVAEGAPLDIQHQASASTLEDAFVRLIGSEEGLN
ncbi:MAG: ATP-binding cassette domain-containing protein [Vicinamibacterales bacterium]